MSLKILTKVVRFGFTVMLSFQAVASLELNEPGKLYVATTGEFPPFSMLDKQGNLSGLEADLMREICHRLNLEYKPLVVRWDSLLIGILSNKFDISSDVMDITPERAQKVDFISWLESTGVFVANSDKDKDILEGLKDKKVGVLVASSYEKEVKKMGLKNIAYYQSQAMAIMDLINKNIDYVATDKLNAEYFMKLNSKQFPIVEIESLRAIKGWAVNKNRPNLYKAIKDELQRLYDEGVYQKIVMKYVNHDPYPKK